MNGACIVCGSTKVLAKDRCATDYHFRVRTGRDRTQDEVLAARHRALVREQERELIRSIARGGIESHP